MAVQSNKRLRLFRRYSNHLNLLKENGLLPDVKLKHDRTYICPICLEQYSEEEGLNTQAQNYLTFEDIPPVTLGGRANILTCRRCNNVCGQTIDHHLTNRMREWDAQQFLPGTEANVKIEYQNRTLQGTIIIEEDGTKRMKHSPGRNHPATLNEYIESVSKPEERIVNLKFLPSKVNFDRLQIALLKIGYLMIFEKFGYAFILDPIYDSVRQQILNPDERIYPAQFWSNQDFLIEKIGVQVVTDRGLECIASVFPLRTHTTRTFITFLPLPVRPIEGVLETLKSSIDGETRMVGMTTYHDDYLQDIHAIKQFLNWIVERQN
jgi:hypothetical protein